MMFFVWTFSAPPRQDRITPARAILIFWLNSYRWRQADMRRHTLTSWNHWKSFSGAGWTWSSPLPSRIRISAKPWNEPKRCSMRLEARKYLYDIQQAVVRISEFTQGKRFEDYQSEAMLRAAWSASSRLLAKPLYGLLA